MPIRSMEQDRAKFALEKIEEANTLPGELPKEIRRYLNSLPALIRMNGLGQALAFFYMKGTDTGHRYIYNMISTWLCVDGSKGRIFTEHNDVLKAITQSEVRHYMAAQNEALALLEWLKKFAVAILPAAD